MSDHKVLTVGELIERLQRLPSDLPVWMDGQEGKWGCGDVRVAPVSDINGSTYQHEAPKTGEFCHLVAQPCLYDEDWTRAYEASLAAEEKAKAEGTWVEPPPAPLALISGSIAVGQIGPSVMRTGRIDLNEKG